MDIYERTSALIGRESLEKLKKSKVIVFGIGGVGSYAVEALARCGVGSLVLVDGDNVHHTNLNRQVHATIGTLGRPKVEAMRERIMDINLDINVAVHQVFVLPEQICGFIDKGSSYVIDAVDTVTSKIGIIETAFQTGVPVISCMGTGNKTDPTRFKVADIYDTSVDPLARVIRRELRKKGIKSLKVVYSDETPVGNHRPPATVSFVPPVAGLIMAGEVVRDLID